MDIFEYARVKVDHKSIGDRILNSGALHKVVSATKGKGSALSKGLGVAVVFSKSALKLIPIPIIGDILSQAVDGGNSYARSRLHTKRSKASTSLDDQVKFDIKELSVADLDRYRWKVGDSIKEANTKIAAYPANYQNKFENNEPCNADLELALAIEQVNRRIYKLRVACGSIKAVLASTENWLDKVEAGVPLGSTPPQITNATQPTEGVIALKNQASKMFKDNLDHQKAHVEKVQKEKGQKLTPQNAEAMHECAEAMRAMHAKCKPYCQLNEAQNAATWSEFSQKFGEITSALLEPFALESFISLDGSAYKKQD